jgi:hypothetical protein
VPERHLLTTRAGRRTQCRSDHLGRGLERRAGTLARDRRRVSDEEGEEGFSRKTQELRQLAPDALALWRSQIWRLRRAIALVSGKSGGYYGCLNATRRSCENRVLISRARLEDKFVGALNEKVLKPEVLSVVYERTAKKIKEHFAHEPEELRLKSVELKRAQSRVHNFIEFIATGRATSALADALSQAEEQVKTLKVDVASIESAQRDVFTPPPPAWIADRVRQLNDLLPARTPRSPRLPCAASPVRSPSRRRSRTSAGRISG